ncbi:MAG: LysR family transcriptional regulator, partial [Betaproteobacteria bacterium]|nr:LysR family transcriptional regulator [Betaproteobacteria bacterium]
MANPRITLDQWNALVSVVESGGYAMAAERLHKSQSTLTYSIKKLESLLGVRVFELKGRKAVLTPTGELLTRRARTLLENTARLEKAAGELAKGWEPEIRIAADILFPTWLLLQCFGEFCAEHPDTHLELYETVLGGTEEALAARRVEFA